MGVIIACKAAYALAFLEASDATSVDTTAAAAFLETLGAFDGAVTVLIKIKNHHKSTFVLATFLELATLDLYLPRYASNDGKNSSKPKPCMESNTSSPVMVFLLSSFTLSHALSFYNFNFNCILTSNKQCKL